MESPIYRNYFSCPPPAAHRAMPTRRPSQKVFSIPSHFLDSGRSQWAAAQIQRAFRGFRVRKALGKIRAVWTEVAAMERRVDDPGTADALRRDERERVRVNELLMGLLFRLDSVPGVDPGVRDCRKTAIRRVMALQERVDSLVEDMEPAANSDDDWELVMEEPHDSSGSDDTGDSATNEADQLPFQVERVKELGAEAGQGGRDEEGSGLKEMMERMVTKNEQLEMMILELCEREVRQRSVVGSLLRRVDMLEKAMAEKDNSRRPSGRFLSQFFNRNGKQRYYHL